MFATADKPPPNLSVEQIQSLRLEIEKKHSVAKARLTYWELLFKAIFKDTEDLKTALSDDTIQNQNLQIRRHVLLMKQKIEELSTKRRDLDIINKEIQNFSGKDTIGEVLLTEKELTEVFGETSERLKRLPKSRRKYITVEKEVPNEDGTGTTTQSERIMKWSIPASISKSMSTLREIQAEYTANVAEREAEIEELKASYLGMVEKLEMIKSILGLKDDTPPPGGDGNDEDVNIDEELDEHMEEEDSADEDHVAHSEHGSDVEDFNDVHDGEHATSETLSEAPEDIPDTLADADTVMAD